MTSPFPPPSPNQVYLTISPLAAGHITLPSPSFISPSPPTEKRTVPSLAFLITHPIHGPSLFDLGLRSSPTSYPPELQSHLSTRHPYTLEPGIVAQLEQHGVRREHVKMVLLSHVHYDHHGDPGHFRHAEFVVGPGALKVVREGLVGKGSHQFFERGLFDGVHVREVREGEWRGLPGGLGRGWDVWGDGSGFVVDLPGHLPGHVGFLGRVGEEKWVLLCGDAFHDRRLLTGEKEVGTWEGEGGVRLCIHLDKEQAERTIAMLREFERKGEGKVELIAAHEDAWWEDNREKRGFPNTL